MILDHLNIAAHTIKAAAKSVARVGILNTKGVKAPTFYERFFCVRLIRYGRSGRPIRGAASFCAVIPTCPVDHPLLGIRRWSRRPIQKGGMHHA